VSENRYGMRAVKIVRRKDPTETKELNEIKLNAQAGSGAEARIHSRLEQCLCHVLRSDQRDVDPSFGGPSRRVTAIICTSGCNAYDDNEQG
jgi:hypothetical protein